MSARGKGQASFAEGSACKAAGAAPSAAGLQVRDHAEEIQSKLTQLENELEALQDIVGCGDQREMLDRLVHKVATLEGALAEAERTRRELHNELVELRGNVRVFCRLRPAATSVVEVQGEQGLRLHSEGRSHAFRFDRVFGQSSDQETVFGQVSDLVQSALDGFKVCLFSYGQTGAGKTYTMLGPPGAGAASQGIIPRAIKKLLSTATRQEEQGWRFDMHAYFVEIYNEMLRDLLADGAKRGAASRITDANPIRHDPNGGHTSVAGASVFQVDSQETAEALIDRAARARSVDATAMNSESSRSHSVFTLNITASSEQQGVKLLGSLSLVDLAGSERLDRSRAEGQRQKETCAINKSLSCLGDVFAALSSKASHIPYRNSKLTHLLQPSLGGSGKTLMLVSLNPEPASAAETLCSLRFACKVNQCEAPGGAARRLVAPLGAASGGVFAAGSDSSSSVSLGQKRKSLHAAASGRHAKLGRFD